MEQWERDNPYRQKLVDVRCKTANEVVQWEVYPEMAANAALVLIAVATSLLDRQVARLARDFEKEGGFTEKMYKVRSANYKQ